MRRPEGGLLAGQWEFPHEIVAAHKEEMPDDPGVAVRGAATASALAAAGVSESAAHGSAPSSKSGSANG